MDGKRVLEERLREAVCVGDTDAVQDLVNLGVDVNARQPVGGWYLSLLESRTFLIRHTCPYRKQILWLILEIYKQNCINKLFI